MIAFAGAGVTLVGTFLPFISMMGIGMSLLSADPIKAILAIALAALAGVFAMMGKAKNNSFPIVALVCGIAGLGLTGYWMSQAMGVGMAGMGAYLMPAGCLLATIGGAMSMKEN